MLGYNMFAYCKNNPIIYVDHTGRSATLAVAVGIAIAEPTPVGEIILVTGLAIVGTVVLVNAGIAIAEHIGKINEASTNEKDDVPQNVTESDDAIEIGETDKLPSQGNVTAVPDAPPVEAGKQRKHVRGHNNYDPNRSSWNEGENGVKQTQEAWKNSKPHPRKPNTRVGFSKDGRKIEIKYSKKGIHGFPIFP